MPQYEKESGIKERDMLRVRGEKKQETVSNKKARQTEHKKLMRMTM